MHIVDSCGWLEYLSGSINADNFVRAIENTSQLIVPTICLHEVFKVILRERNENEAIQAIALMHQGRIVDLTTEISLLSARVSFIEKVPMADSIVIATALIHDATIYTQDEHFKHLKNVKYFKKK